MREAVLIALREIDRRLMIYPQFGEPSRDLTATPGAEWAGFVGPRRPASPPRRSRPCPPPASRVAPTTTP